MGSTWEEFWFRYYSSTLPSNRHWYEIIVSTAPCRGYFDVEYDKTLNPSVDGEELLDMFMRFVAMQLAVEFDIYVDRSNFLDLDSSTDVKFSRHLILHCPGGLLWENNLILSILFIFFFVFTLMFFF